MKSEAGSLAVSAAQRRGMDKAWMMQVSELVFLYLCAGEDCKNRKLCVPRFWVFGVVGMIEYFFLKPFFWQDLAIGVGIGGAILLFSYMSQGMIGQGDGWLFCVTGIYLGGDRNLALLLLSGWLCAGYLLFGIFRKKYRRKDKIAFAPFVLTAQVILLCLM